jgi:PAS domain S-box-containing protein
VTRPPGDATTGAPAAAPDHARDATPTAAPLVAALFTQSPLSVALYDAEGRVAAGNAAYERHFGIRVADVPREWSLFTDAQLDAAGLLPLIRRAYAGETVTLPAVRYDAAAATGAHGRTVWTQAHCYPVRAESPGAPVTHVAVVHVDVTAWAEADAALRASEARYRALVEAAPQLAWVNGPDGAVGFFNERWYRYTGQDPRAAAGAGWLEAVHVDERAGLDAARRDAIAGGEAYALEMRLRRHDGVYRWFAARVVPLRDDAGAVVAWHGAALDVTEREEALARERLARAAADRAAERTARLQAVTAALATALTPDDVARVAVDQGVAALGAAAGALAVLTPDGAAVRTLRAVGYPDADVARYARFPLGADFPPAEAVRTGLGVWLGSAAERDARYPGLAELRRRNGDGAMAAVPIYTTRGVDAGTPGDAAAPGAAIGALSLNFAEPRAFDAEDRAFVGTLARLAGQALERARLYEAERAARGEAEEARGVAERANRARADFVASMSHELRTPLNAIQGYVQLLDMGLHGPVTAEQREALGRVSRAQTHLLGLINDVLNFTKLEAGRVEFDVRPTRVADVVRDVAPLVEPQLRAKGLAFAVRVPDDGAAGAAALVWADREKLGQVLVNLLSNAVKFTPAVQADGTPGRVTVDFTEQAGEPRVAYLRVHDTGIGIPGDKQDAVFDPFVQVSTGLTRTSEGTGLGLAISRDLARGMGGDLDVRSAPGEGSTFTVTLRRAGAAARG